jgi:hypothetical protein
MLNLSEAAYCADKAESARMQASWHARTSIKWQPWLFGLFGDTDVYDFHVSAMNEYNKAAGAYLQCAKTFKTLDTMPVAECNVDALDRRFDQFESRIARCMQLRIYGAGPRFVSSYE